MAETFVENQVCESCGAEVRKGALFCYNCGGAITPEVVSNENKTTAKPEIPEFSSKESRIENNLGEVKTEPKIKEPLPEPARKIVAEPTSFEKSKLKSAAVMRGNPKQIQPRKIEIIWEESQNAPNMWFILTTIFLTVLAAVILFLAIRMK